MYKIFNFFNYFGDSLIIKKPKFIINIGIAIQNTLKYHQSCIKYANNINNNSPIVKATYTPIDEYSLNFPAYFLI